MKRVSDPFKRFWAHALIGDDCWEWVGRHNPHGYSRFYVRELGRWVVAHRIAYEMLVGPIPEGLTIDHLCRNRGCVRPEHMEPVTQKVNMLRGNTLQAANARKTECPRGHPYDLLNTYYDRNGGRECRTCRKERDKSRSTCAKEAAA